MRGEGRGVRVYTVANESRYLVVRNIPAVGVLDELRARLSQFGAVLAFRVLDHPDDRARALGPFRGHQRRRQPAPDAADADAQRGDGQEDGEDEDEDEPFTDVVWVQYETVNNARHAKARAAHKPFFGSMLRISYAPQDETPLDTALKLAQRRELLLRRARQQQLPGGSLADRARQQQQQRLGWQQDDRACAARGERYIGPPPPPLPPPARETQLQLHRNYARLQSPLPPAAASVKRRRI